MSDVNSRADEAWRKINHRYDKYSSDEFFVLYELFVEAFGLGEESVLSIWERAGGKVD